MQQLVSVWSGLEMTKRVLAILAAIVAFVAILTLTRLAAAPSMALLYSGLDQTQSGTVISALEQNGTAYEVRGSGIFVEESQRDALRMSLAAEGLPDVLRAIQRIIGHRYDPSSSFSPGIEVATSAQLLPEPT